MRRSGSTGLSGPLERAAIAYGPSLVPVAVCGCAALALLAYAARRLPTLADAEGYFERLARIEQDKLPDFEARFCWFLRMDPQVKLLHGSAAWVVERYGVQIERLRRAGDEVGLHTHAWRRVGEEWVIDHGDQGWVNECVQVSFDAYESAFGHPCRSFRFGDHWIAGGDGCRGNRCRSAPRAGESPARYRFFSYSAIAFLRSVYSTQGKKHSLSSSPRCSFALATLPTMR